MIENIDRIQFDRELFDKDKSPHEKPKEYERIRDKTKFIGVKMSEPFHIPLPSQANEHGEYDFTSNEKGECPCFHGGTIGGKPGDYILLADDGMVIGCAAVDPKNRRFKIFESKFTEA